MDYYSLWLSPYSPIFLQLSNSYIISLKSLVYLQTAPNFIFQKFYPLKIINFHNLMEYMSENLVSHIFLLIHL